MAFLLIIIAHLAPEKVQMFKLGQPGTKNNFKDKNYFPSNEQIIEKQTIFERAMEFSNILKQIGRWIKCGM